jgi:asparagine synthase (glutamine-hydrolysing)
MCGIAGWIDWAEDLSYQGPLIEAMVDTLNHRGPDVKGRCWLSPRAALAHRRLIVIDPRGGAQPMIHTASDHSYAVTYNGEIYNFRELRSELETRGHTFATQSDTEVLLHSYLEWGEECVRQFNGIFAFGLWDSKKQRLLLARDHLGVKPLFFAQRGSALLFASELKALLIHPLVKAEVDGEGFAELCKYGPRTPGCAVYRDVHELRPGRMLVCSANCTRNIQYWVLPSAPHNDDLVTTRERIRMLLEDTVRRQMISDVPISTLLSGGLDSSGVTALAAKEMKRDRKALRTYSIDIADSAQHFHGNALRPGLDAPWVERVSNYVQSNHQTIVVDTPELLDSFLVPMRAHDLPGMGQVETSLYLLFKGMKKEVTVALSGESADELFGGYPWFHRKDAVAAETFPWDVMMTGEEGGMREDRYAWLSPAMIENSQPREYCARRYREALTEVPRLEGEDPRAARMREISYLNLTRFLSLLLERKDRMSMAVGLEARVPYCDYRLVEYVWNIPWEMKMVDNIEKGILRQVFADVLPDDVRNRKKSGFPSSQNPSYLGAVRSWTLDILNDSNAPVLPLINTNLVRAVAEGKAPRIYLGEWEGFLFEHVIQINAWLKEYGVTVQ